jgi:DUF971 family protein
VSENGCVPDAAPMRAEKIDVERDRGLTVVYEDGRECFFPLEDLRLGCPCASCRAVRDRGERVWPRPGGPATLRIVDAELVGNWGINLTWNDGHATGIFPWDALRSWCERREDAGGA